MVGVKVGLALVHFSHQDWVSLDWFGQFTASQLFNSVTISMMNGFARLRFEFIIHNKLHTLAIESRVVAILAPVPFVSHQDGVCLDWFKGFTASQPFQCLIISIMNGWRRLRLVYVLYEGRTATCFPVTGGVKVGMALVHHFSHQDWVSLDWFGQITASQPFHSLTISIMNDYFARLRFEFIIHNQPHTPIFESWVVTISVYEYEAPTFHTKMVYVRC